MSLHNGGDEDEAFAAVEAAELARGAFLPHSPAPPAEGSLSPDSRTLKNLERAWLVRSDLE